MGQAFLRDSVYIVFNAMALIISIYLNIWWRFQISQGFPDNYWNRVTHLVRCGNPDLSHEPEAARHT
jgi:hypothetical protein